MRFNYKFENILGMMPYKYSCGKIYKLLCNKTNKVYYGSTVLKLKARLKLHERDYKKSFDNKRHISSFDILKNNDYKIELVENYPCNNRKELERREGFFQKNYECINKVIAGRKDKEYYNDNRDKIEKYRKEYYNDNRDKILKDRKEYRNENKEKISNNLKEIGMVKMICICGSEFTKYNKHAHKKTIKHITYMNSINNDDIKIEYIKPKINAIRRNEQIQCICGTNHSRCNTASHLKTIKHIKFINQIT